MKSIFYFLLAITLCACNSQPNWVSELEAKNPLKDSTNIVSVYFRFDTIINDYEVSGILYPFYTGKRWSYCENGVRLFFHNLKTDQEYVWTDWDEEANSFKWYFMSCNVRDLVFDKRFKGFKTGDFYTFDYNSTRSVYSNNVLMPYAEYQFFDADFDGEDELILGYYAGGPRGGVCFEIYDVLDTALVRKEPIGEHSYFCLDANSVIDQDNKMIINYLYNGCSEWGTYAYQADDEGNFRWLYYASTECDVEGKIYKSDTTFFSL